MNRLRRGARLGKYRLERKLGLGASAEVWLCHDTVQHRRVAVKVVTPAFVAIWGRAAIEHEARVAARLDHPNIVAIRNADWVGEYFLIVSDPALRNLAESTAARRSPELALSLLRDAAAGLAYAHLHKVLHRDVKPANILIYPGQVARLGDFGTARFAPLETRLQTEVGTMGYMAPEQAYGRPRYSSDVFALGLTAFELLTGRLPTWPFEWPFGVSARVLSRIPQPLQPVLRRALELRQAQRWQDGGALLRAFDRALEQSHRVPTRDRPASTRRRPASPFELEVRWFRRQHGKTLGLRFECHSCSGPIAEAMIACPWCGSDRNSFAELTEAPLVCPDCERGVRPEWNACPWCYPVRFEGNGRKPPPDSKAERSCRKHGCGGQLRPFMRYCPMCKTKVARPWRVADLDRCRRCKWPTSDHWRFCPWCSRRQRDVPKIKRGG